MWYNPVVYTEIGALTDTQILWAIYQHFVATTSLFFGLLIFYAGTKLLLWILPKYWNRGKE